MQLDSFATGIVRRILRPDCDTDMSASIIVAESVAARVEPLQRFAALTGKSEREIYAAAAEALGLVFLEDVPPAVELLPGKAAIDRLADEASIRGRLIDRDVLFVSPNFEKLVELGRKVQIDPNLTRSICVVPPRRLRAAVARQNAAGLTERALNRLAQRWPNASAHRELTLPVRAGFAVLLLCLVFAAAFLPDATLTFIAPLLALFYLAPAALRLFAATAGVFKAAREDLPRLPDPQLPVYTILIPLRDEADLVPQLLNAMLAIDYPREKLDIKFVVEQTSRSTLNALRKELDRGPFDLIEVPDSVPLTKPKALNFALPLSTGELVVVFDAEDVPEPDQLRLAAAKFHERPELDCLQAELVIDNARENVLTYLYTGEYAAQFGLILPALASLGLPMPLGGTSNHFRMQALLETGGWDSFNVTEDADLGVRLARLRYRCGTLASATYEEAPVGFSPWLRQRTRWMKGWMQTLIVHNQHPLSLLKDMGIVKFLAFEIYVGGLVLTAPVHAIFLGLLAFRLTTQGFAGIWHADFWSIFFLTVLALGYSSTILVALMGLARFGRLRLGWAQLLLPFYWILTSLASLRAAWQLLTNPFVWEKTAHARTRLARKRFTSGETADRQK